MTDFLEPPRRCHACGADLSLGTLVCDKCHSLVHSEQLAILSHRAQQLEDQNDYSQARLEWNKALALLPPNITQAEWIRAHLGKLDLAQNATPVQSSKNAWAKKFGPLGPILLVLAKGKFLLTALFKLKFLLSFIGFAGFYWALYGPWFGVGFVVLIFVHEMGHYIDIRRRGLPAEMPVFLPGLGAYVKWDAMGVTRLTRAFVSLAGPLAGFFGSAICFYIWQRTGSGVWAALARSSAWLNILNLIPVWVLDGGQATLALSKIERWILLGLCVTLWLALGQGLFFLVAAGFVYRLFTKDLPPMPAPKITAYYAALMIALSLLMFFTPGRTFAAH
jgi:Zn-dependent protease